MHQEAEERELNVRSVILTKAGALINGDRQKDYGPPEQNFARIAQLWNSYLLVRFNVACGMDPADVAYMMALLKLARACHVNGTMDTSVDMAGYVALAGELSGVRDTPAKPAVSDCLKPSAP